jgi:hypothetical protein
MMEPNPMNRSWTSRRARALGLLGALALTLMLGCASAPQSPTPPDDGALIAAGFKVIVAKTKEQQEHLQALPQGQLIEWQRTGKHYFVYPDLAKSRLLVGTPREYEAYLRLRPAESASAALAKQRASDLASYNKQDDAMRMYTTRDLADPYYFWDSFDGLGWR